MVLAVKLAWISFNILPQTSYGQLPPYEKTHGVTIQFNSVTYLDDLFKRPYKQNTFPDTKGSPFYHEDWKFADLALKDGKLFNRVRVRLNLYTQELICLSAGSIEITLKDGITTRMTLYDTSETGLPGRRVFVSGIPVVDKDTSFPFFEVIKEGNASLLNLVKKKITNRKDALSPGDQKEFETVETFYVFINMELKKCEKNCDFFVTLFSDKKDSVENFIKSRKLRCRNREDLSLLVEYYNTL